MAHESRLHNLLKAISWRIFSTNMTVFISYTITHKLNFAIYIGISEFAFKTVLFYLHKKLWIHIHLNISPRNYIESLQKFKIDKTQSSTD